MLISPALTRRQQASAVIHRSRRPPAIGTGRPRPSSGDQVPPAPDIHRSAARLAELTRRSSGPTASGSPGCLRVARGRPVPRPRRTRGPDAAPPGARLASHRTAAALLGAPVRTGWPRTFTVHPGMYRPRAPGPRVHSDAAVRTTDLVDTRPGDVGGPDVSRSCRAAGVRTSWSPRATRCSGTRWTRPRSTSASVARPRSRVHGAPGRRPPLSDATRDLPPGEPPAVLARDQRPAEPGAAMSRSRPLRAHGRAR